MTNIIELGKRLFEEDIGTIVSDTARNLVDQGIKSVTDKVDGFRRDLQYGDNIVASGYEALFRQEVARRLRDYNGVQVIELSADGLERFEYIDEHTGENKKGLLGFREDTTEGTRIYIPRKDEVGRLVGTELDDYMQKAVYHGIRIHELMEASAYRPHSEEEHKEFEGLILRSLKDLADDGDKLARKAYVGTLKVLELRKERGDVYYQGVNQYYPVDAALAV